MSDEIKKEEEKPKEISQVEEQPKENNIEIKEEAKKEENQKIEENQPKNDEVENTEQKNIESNDTNKPQETIIEEKKEEKVEIIKNEENINKNEAYIPREIDPNTLVGNDKNLGTGVAYNSKKKRIEFLKSNIFCERDKYNQNNNLLNGIFLLSINESRPKSL